MRALLCLIVVSFLVIQTARGVRVDVVWSEALMITLAHYFTTRRFVPLSHELRAKLEAAGEIEPDESPLYLPKHSVRILLIGAFAGLAFYLYDHGRLFEAQSLSLLVSVGAYLLGITVRGILAWWSSRTGITSPAWWVDFKAFGTLLIVLAAVGLQLARRPRRPRLGLLAAARLQPGPGALLLRLAVTFVGQAASTRACRRHHPTSRRLYAGGLRTTRRAPLEDRRHKAGGS